MTKDININILDDYFTCSNLKLLELRNMVDGYKYLGMNQSKLYTDVVSKYCENKCNLSKSELLEPSMIEEIAMENSLLFLDDLVDSYLEKKLNL